MGIGHAHTLYLHGHSRVHRLEAETKVVAVFVFVVAVAVTPREAVWAFAIDAGVATAVLIAARIPFRFLVARLAGILPFIAFAFLIPFIASGEQIDLGLVSVSKDGLWAAWNIMAKATLGATAAIILAATTEVQKILRGMTVLRVPAVFVSIAGFMIRYLELIVEELGRMRLAMESRGYDPRWLWQIRPIASASGALFVRSYERGERVHAAMTARGFTGVMPVLDARRTRAEDWVLAVAPASISAVVALVALVVA